MAQMIGEIKDHHKDDSDPGLVEASLLKFENSSLEEKDAFIKELKSKTKAGETPITKSERKQMKAAYRQELVQRSMLYKIAAAWVITVPASGLLAALFYFFIRGVMAPY